MLPASSRRLRPVLALACLSGALGCGGGPGSRQQSGSGGASGAGVTPGQPDAGGGVTGQDAGSDASRGDGGCAPACGPHATCVTGGTAGCACVAGYVDAGSGCLWGGLLRDPGFTGVPADAWTLAGGATLAPVAGGFLDPGELQMDAAAICAGASARQTITMPRAADSGPLALRVTSTAACSGGPYGPASCFVSGTGVMVNGSVLPFTSTELSAVAFSCLGERAYGGTYDLVVRPLDRGLCGSASTFDTAVDHVDIEPMAGCPMPGTLPDGDFDADAGTWTVSGVTTSNVVSGSSIGEIQPGTGSNGSRAGHLNATNRCLPAQLQEQISPPLSAIPNLALQLAYQATGTAPLALLLDGITLSTFTTGASGWTTARVCIPEGLKGTSVAAAFQLPPVALLNGPCTDGGGDFLIDDLKFVSDPSCPAAAWLVDGSFERPEAASLVQVAAYPQGLAGATPSAAIDATPANALGGTHALMLANNNVDTWVTASFPISIPPPATGGGPALALHYRAPLLQSSILTVQIGSAPPVFRTTGAAPAYTTVQTCLDPTTGGETQPLIIKLAGPLVGSTDAYPAETVWLDDFTVGNSADCPSD